jgi:lipid-A-disaccharide synthase
LKYYIIAGEASGDMHAANLMHEIKLLDTDAEFRCWGGDRMLAEGGNVIKHIRELAFMGFVEVLLNIRTISKNLNFCKKDLIAYQPDALILVDYPGFNLRISEYAKSKGLKVFYYISPSVWAWKESRVEIIKKSVDKLFAILPFEKDFYKKHNFSVEYVGHPLLDAIDNYRKENTGNSSFLKEINPEGKSRAFINDTPVTLNQLKELGERLIDIHSQHQTLSLNGADFQLSVVDAFAKHEDVLIEYKTKNV